MKRLWTVEELAEHWTLNPDELGLLANKAGHTRLGFAVLLKFFQCEARFPESRQEVAGGVVAHIARQVGVETQEYVRYDWDSRSIKYHRAQIREHLGFREATARDGEDLALWLSEQVLPGDQQPKHLLAAAYARCRALRIEPPTPGRMERLIASALRAHEGRFCSATLERLSPETLERMDALLVTGDADPPLAGSEPSKQGRSLLQEMKADPGRAGLESVFEELEKLRLIRELELPQDLFAGVPPKVLQVYRQRAATEAPSELRAHPEPVRATLVSALCWVREREITDGLAELLIDLVHRIGARAERRVERELLEDLKRVTGKASLLYRIAEAAVEHPDGTIREVLWPVAGGEQTFRDLVREYRATGPAYRRRVHTHLRASYQSHYRRMVPRVLEALEFRSNNTIHRPAVEALALLRKYAGSQARQYAEDDDVPIEGVVPPGWRDLVVVRNPRARERVDRINYEICALGALREGLRSKEIWVVGADRYRNPDDDLPGDFDIRRSEYYEALKQPAEAEIFLDGLKGAMGTALEALDADMPRNPSVKLSEKGNGWISLAALEAQPEPTNLGHLKDEIATRWPMTNLLDILKEADLRTGFTEHFTTAASREILDPETLQKRLLLCLFGLGTNTGLKRVSAGDPGSSYQDLRYVRRKYIHKAQLRAAIAHLANAIFAARRPEVWGEGTTACASDSKKFGAWDQNLMTEWHIRYGGRGVMIYWHVEKKSTCIYSQLKSCSSSEVAAMIEGVLRHCTEMSVDRNYVDSQGQSEVAFAFTYLLGFRLLPRLRAINTQKLYRPATRQDDAYSNLQPVLTRSINWTLIRQQYDEMVKYATALRVGTAETESILRRFTRDNVQHPTYRALSELGKAVKTVFLCEYLSSEALRREIQEGLNTIENWNSANGFIFYGKGGEIATNRLDDQEVSVLALHLLQIALVYVNTLMIQGVLEDQRWSGSMGPEDLRALTPLIYSHVNPYGTFRLDMSERLPLEHKEAV